MLASMPFSVEEGLAVDRWNVVWFFWGVQGETPAGGILWALHKSQQSQDGTALQSPKWNPVTSLLKTIP